MGEAAVAAEGGSATAEGRQGPPARVERTPPSREPQHLEHLHQRIPVRVGRGPDTIQCFCYRVRCSRYTANTYAKYRRPPRYQVPVREREEH